MKKSAIFVVLAVIMAAVWMLSAVAGMSIFGVDAGAGQESSIQGVFLLLLSAGINTGVIYALVVKARWRGWKLVGAVSIVIFGIQFFLTQIETLYFNEALGLPTNLVYSIMFTGFVLAISVSAIAVKMLGKWKAEGEGDDAYGKFLIDLEFIVKVGILAVIVYPVLYFSAGYFIAWQSPGLRILYSGSDNILPFLQHFQRLFQTDLVLFPFQIIRGFLWIGIAMVIMKFVSAGWKTKATLVGIAFALLMNSQHLIPNPYQPRNVQLYHFIETASSNFVWGFAIVWLLEGRKKILS